MFDMESFRAQLGRDTRPTPTRRCPDHHHQPSQSNSTSSRALRVSAPRSQRRFQRRSRCRQRLPSRRTDGSGGGRSSRVSASEADSAGFGSRARRAGTRQWRCRASPASTTASSNGHSAAHRPAGYNPASNGSRRADHSQGSAKRRAEQRPGQPLPGRRWCAGMLLVAPHQPERAQQQQRGGEAGQRQPGRPGGEQAIVQGVAEQVFHRRPAGQRRPHDRQRRQDQQQPAGRGRRPSCTIPAAQRDVRRTAPAA